LKTQTQLFESLDQKDDSLKNTPRRNGTINKLSEYDAPAHNWYRFVLSFPPHLVQQYLEKFNIKSKHLVLDPFCGTGTTNVECKKKGIPSIGIEANPMACFASQTKVNWGPDPQGLVEHSLKIADLAHRALQREGIKDSPLLNSKIKIASLPKLKSLPEEGMKVLLKDSISPLPLHKALVLLDYIKKYQNHNFYNHQLLALANALVNSISNLRFGPEVGLGKIKEDVQVIDTWVSLVKRMVDDIEGLKNSPEVKSSIYLQDSRKCLQTIELKSIDSIITSPPYPNEKDYSRTTRLESVILGFIRNKTELRDFKRNLVCSNTRTVYKDDDHDQWIENNLKIQKIAKTIEAKRIELGKTSGFEKLYGRATKLYFGSMHKHLEELRPYLKPGASLSYVVGDQASYFRIHIPTGQILAEIAETLGYKVLSFDLFRKRFSTATKKYLREEVVNLEWKGK
jgi:DNA modification methylase